MLAANRSYRARISYLPAEADQLAAAGKVRRHVHSHARQMLGSRCGHLAAHAPPEQFCIQPKLDVGSVVIRCALAPLPARLVHAQVCTAGCDLCRLGREHMKLQTAFREASTRSLTRR